MKCNTCKHVAVHYQTLITSDNIEIVEIAHKWKKSEAQFTLSRVQLAPSFHLSSNIASD